jgi:protease I
MFGNKTDPSTTPSLSQTLAGKNVAILSCEGFEQSELFDPKAALEKAGATVKIISPKSGTIKAWNKTDWGKSIDVDLTLDAAQVENFDALMLPGGVMNPDKLRQDKQAVAFVKSFFTAGKPVGAICHGPQVLIETGELKGRTITSWPSLKTDITNAGAKWVDEEVIVENGLVTSRKPDDIPAFSKKLIQEIVEGQKVNRQTSGLRMSAMTQNKSEQMNNNQISEQKKSGAV